MDNGFENSFPQRTERDEYRSKFRFADEDTPRETQRSKSQRTKPTASCACCCCKRRCAPR